MSAYLSRRTLLLTPIALAASSSWLPAHAQNHAQHGKMSMPATASAPLAEELAPDSALPSGLPLNPLVPLTNSSTEPGVFRARLTAAPVQVELIAGSPTTIWAYNGITPGPQIEVREGDRVEIEFVNQLPQASTIHWHGLPVPADQDGSPMDLVEPGSSRIYRFTIPRGSAGTYWYHPHPHLMTAEQVYRGLAGTFIVRAANDPLTQLPERQLVISDLKLTRSGRIPPNTVQDWMNGREGQFALVNGQLRPLITGQGTERWRIWNASSARYLKLSLGGLSFSQVGTDGGLMASARHGLKELLLAPAERAELIISPPSGQRLQLWAESYDRGLMDLQHMLSADALESGHTRRPPDPRRLLADIQWQAGSPGQFAVPNRLRDIQPLGEAKVQRQVLFTEVIDRQALQGINEQSYLRPRGLDFQVNSQLYDTERIDFHVKRGEVEHWEIINATTMDHPFHIHGTQFQVIERVADNVVTPEPTLAWRDTVNVRPAEIVRIKVAQDLPGLRMFHCHILEHEDLGMMANLMVK